MIILPDSGLALPTASLMSSGGDDRITVDELSGLNSYGCAPAPKAAIAYSSTTASTIGADAFRHVEAVHFRLREQVRRGAAAAVYAQTLETARARIRAIYQTGGDIAVAFGPSGTDLEYLALAIALRTGQKVCNLVVEVDEVGSGCQFSQSGQYFAPRTAQGSTVQKGAFLPGFDPARIRVQTLQMRGRTGPVEAPERFGRTLDEAVASALADGERPLVHVIHRSKTGIIAPSLGALDALLARYGGAIDVVVDACQGRISPAAVNAYLERGAMIFITGSKFFGGPPFSAFALVPPRLGARMDMGEPAQAGLADLFLLGDMPSDWHDCTDVLPETANFATALRLEAALFEMERFFALPADRVDAIITAFNAAMKTLPETLPFRLVDTVSAGDLSEHGAEPLDRKALHVVEMTLANPATGAPLTFADAQQLYHLLYRDISEGLADPEDGLVASTICHLGQPVRCLRRADGEWAATLRLALSAPLVTALLGLDAQRLAFRFAADLERIGRKMRLAARLLSRPVEQPAAHKVPADTPA